MENVKFIAVKEIEITDFGEEQIVFNPNKDTVHLLNRTSSEILALLNEPKSLDNIIGLFRAKYGDIKELDEDIAEILNTFTEFGVVERLDNKSIS